jgi:hypothetical protein
MIADFHEAHHDRIAATANTLTTNTTTFSKTARVAILAGAGKVGRAYKVVFTYRLETSPEAVAKFLRKLTLQSRHDHITPHTSHLKPAKNLIPLKAVTCAFSWMPT